MLEPIRSNANPLIMRVSSALRGKATGASAMLRLPLFHRNDCTAELLLFAAERTGDQRLG
jgi:hypothetical protein